MNRRLWTSLASLAAGASLLAGCGDGSRITGQTPDAAAALATDLALPPAPLGTEWVQAQSPRFRAVTLVGVAVGQPSASESPRFRHEGQP